MNKTHLLGTVGAVAAFAALAVGFTASATRPALADTKLDKAQVEEIVRDYLLKNPEILLEVQDALEAKQKDEQKLAALGVIKENKDAIFNSAFDTVVGNPKGKVTIVEFYDYNCGFCKRAMSDMAALTKTNPDLRFVLKEFPILGPDSQKAHVVSQAFQKLMPQKAGEFHLELLGGQTRATEDVAIKVAVSLGADEAKLREAMKDPAIIERFAKTYDLANKLAITGTPSYVIGNEVVFGALGADVLEQKIKTAKPTL